MYLKSIDEKVKQELNKKGLKSSYPYPNKNDFIECKFEIIDPLNNEVLKTYTFTKSEFLSLPFSEKSKLKNFTLKEIFNEKEYNKVLKNYQEYVDKYEKEYKKVEENILKDYDKDKVVKVAKIMNVFRDYIDFDDLAIDIFEPNIVEKIEKEIYEILQK